MARKNGNYLSYEERIRKAYPDLSKSFVRLADFLLDSYIDAAFMTATELGHAVDLDATTVVRFSQHLGYAGYPDLLRDIRDRVRDQIMARPQAAHKDSLISVVRTALQELRTIFGQTYLLLDVDVMARLVEKIGQARRIVLLPDNLAQPSGYTLVNLLERGKFFVSMSQTSATDMARVVQAAEKDDLLLAIDVSGDAPYLSNALAEARARNIATAAIVGSASSQAARVGDFVLIVPAQPTIELRMMLVNGVVYALCQALRWRYAVRFSGVDQGVAHLAEKIQHSPE
ncbi:MAG TPA: MurR/RpiR family transcriptional regulator [Anaerolineales bacterium]|nr:MurR/RpiR family transcriptional regulator [Anaerolineales bacterium]